MSAKKRGESDEPGQRRSRKSARGGGGSNRGGGGGGPRRPSDLGRALRSVYDDTLREAIPEDFLSLIGKLS